MLNVSANIRSLTDFKRNTITYVKRLKKSGTPLFLTVNGKAELVVHDADSYQKLLDRAEAIEGIRKGLGSFRRGKGIALAKSEARMRRKYAISR